MIRGFISASKFGMAQVSNTYLTNLIINHKMTAYPMTRVLFVWA